MEFTYTPEKHEKIMTHENRMLKKYLEIIDGYAASFKQHNCTIKSGLIWTNFLKRNKTTDRLPFENGYACYVYCGVERDGEILRYADEEGEVDYFELSTCWSVSSISRCFFNLKVNLYKNTGDAIKDLDDLLRKLQEL